MSKTHEDIPKDHPVQPLKPGETAEDKMTCHQCGLSWDDAIPTMYTPAPSARCPFEAFHITPEENKVPTAEQIENDPRYEDILAACGHGVMSSGSTNTCYALVAILSWWNVCEPPVDLTDVDDVITNLKAFKEAVRKDPSIVVFK